MSRLTNGPERCWQRLTAALLVVAALALAGCSDDEKPCAGTDTIVPGVGVGLSSGAACIGVAPSQSLLAALGRADTTHDLGALGERRSYAAAGVSLLLARPATSSAGAGASSGGSETDERVIAAIYLAGKATAKTAGGVGVGSDESALQAELGAGALDPFTGSRVYREKGLAATLAQGKVTSIVLMPLPK